MKTYKIELEKAIAAVLSRAQDAGHLALDPEPVVYSAEQTPIMCASRGARVGKAPRAAHGAVRAFVCPALAEPPFQRTRP